MALARSAVQRRSLTQGVLRTWTRPLVRQRCTRDPFWGPPIAAWSRRFGPFRDGVEEAADDLQQLDQLTDGNETRYEAHDGFLLCGLFGQTRSHMSSKRQPKTTCASNTTHSRANWVSMPPAVSHGKPREEVPCKRRGDEGLTLVRESEPGDGDVEQCVEADKPRLEWRLAA